ncbi:MAG: hypothetical protein ACJAYU_000661 [Bradymonadia bacterium]|jgi:hypothetical protein
MTSFTRRTALIGLAGAFAMSAPGCSILGDTISDLATITVPVTYEIPRSIPIAFPGDERLAALQNDGADVYPIVNYLPIDLSSVSSQIPGAEVVEEVRIVGISMDVEGNSLSTPLEAFDFRIGEPGTELIGQEVGGADWDSALSVGITDEQVAAFVGVVPAVMNQGNLSPAGQQIADLSFGFGIGTQLEIPAGNLQEGGVANVRFTLELEFIIKVLN